MTCPGCAYEGPYAAMRCPQCRSIFDTEAVERLGHLVYLRERLEGWRAEGLLSYKDANTVLGLTHAEIGALATRLEPAALRATTSAVPAASVLTAPPEPAAAPAAAVPAAAAADTVTERLPE